MVWAGGAGGFASDAAAMTRETALLGEILRFMEVLWEAAPGAARAAHAMSSAGGLFEGVTQVGADTPPAPRRAYGEGKLAQEEMLGALDPSVDARLYRPSSVYGFAGSARVGLVTALIGDALSGRTTRIVGNPSTLRDYVAAGDIGRFVAARLRAPGPRPARPYLLARGRSASMVEVIGHVEAALGLRLRLRYDPRPSNALDMSFRPSALPPGWAQRDLRTGVALTAMRMREHRAGLADPAHA
jgi:UDP-glucose 4-epimerase